MTKYRFAEELQTDIGVARIRKWAKDNHALKEDDIFISTNVDEVLLNDLQMINVSVAGLEPRCSSQAALVSNNSPGPQRSALDAAGKVFPVFGRLSISTSHQD